MSLPERIVRLGELIAETTPERLNEAGANAAVACTLAPPTTVPLRNYSRLDAPAFAPKSRRRFMAPLEYEAQAVRLYALPGVSFFGSAGLFATGGAFVAESAAHWRPEAPGGAAELIEAHETRMGRRLVTGQPTRLDGAWLLAASLYSRNYYHWTFELLAAAALLARRGMLAGLKVLVERRTPLVEASLGALGVGSDDIVVLPADRPLTVERLVFASCFLSETPRTHPAVAEAVAALKTSPGAHPPPAPSRRVFASRGASPLRRLANREALEAAFAAEGFEVVDPGALSFEEQVRLFDAAEVVVGEHGANLTNLVYCRPETLVLELFHPTEMGWGALCFLTLAETRELLHRSVIGEALEGDGWRVDVAAALAAWRDAEQRRAAYRDRLKAWRAGAAPEEVALALRRAP